MDDKDAKNTAPVEEVKLITTTPVVAEKAPLKPKLNLKILVIGLLVLVAVVLIIFSVFFNKTSINTKLPPPEPENVLLATVKGENILSQELLDLAGTYVLESQMDKNDLKQYLDKLIERKILDIEAKSRAIVLDESEATKDLDETMKSWAPRLYQRDRDENYYKLLKSQISARFISSMALNIIGFWVPGPNDPEVVDVPDHDAKRKTGIAALEKIEGLIRSGTDPYKATTQILPEYPLLNKVLAYNGGILGAESGGTISSNPIEYELSKLKTSRPYLYDGVLLMKEGETKTLIEPNGRGASIVQVVSRRGKEFNSYDEFISLRKKELVKFKDKI